MTDYVTIREVADHFRLPVSTLHYWERCGLVTSARRAGSRIYDSEQVYRIALVDMWRHEGRLSVEDISELLQGQDDWQRTVTRRISDIDSRIDELSRARDYLGRLRDCGHGPELVQCPLFRRGVTVPAALQRSPQSRRTAPTGSASRH
ncbi:MerR family transcriptional regulator [Mycolicibacterium sp. HK-90]|uniref:helix-turn-helix domain-containing protein n=1 Tax=Mycolicibacterium sp. HK-90 TaxID=3056937 RepID=UPI002659D501|nr:MerR family transcriptional regulator [Mycolicibacterium sp. HK-90]WKG03786.1 MerR family transcriptional regulator [Mycolicibacterium sp. HK-90]